MRRKALANYLRKKSEKYHEPIHALIGVLCAVIVKYFYPDSDFVRLIVIGIVGNLIPDIDHLLFLFVYGRKSEYAKIVKRHIKNKEFKDFLLFIRNNHKNNTSIYSHNILALILSIFLAWYLGESRDRAGFYTFFMSWSSHYVFDMFEDLLFFKKLNPNWYMRFNKVKRDFIQSFSHDSTRDLTEKK